MKTETVVPFSNDTKAIFEAASFIGPNSYFAIPGSKLMFPYLGNELLCWAGPDGRPNLAYNRCVHRGMRLVSNHLSRGPLVCPYHSLSYDDSGISRGRGTLAGRSLEQVPGVGGQSSFVVQERSQSALATSRVPLDHSQFPTGISGTPFHSDVLLHKCNWKLIIENVLEAKHISSVHRNTFVKQGFISTNYSELEFNNDFSYAELKKVGKQRGYYRHFYMWPNLFVSDTDGMVTFVSTIFPVNEYETLKIWHIYPSEFLLRTPLATQQKVLQQSVDFTKTVLDEDKEILEEQQKTYGHYSQNHLDLPQEERVQWFYDRVEKVSKKA